METPPSLSSAVLEMSTAHGLYLVLVETDKLMKTKVMTFHFYLSPCGPRTLCCGHLLFLILRTLFEPVKKKSPFALTGPEGITKPWQECVLCLVIKPQFTY